MEGVIACTSERGLLHEKLYSFSIVTLSNYHNDNWFIYPPLQREGVNKVSIHDA